jgi:two-component sensor histidine kinase/HAMP domain-containing protein
MKFNLRLKFLTFTFGIILLVGGTISLYSIYQGRQRLFTTFTREGRDITAMIAEIATNDLYFLNLLSLRRRLENARVNPDISFTYVMDLEGAVVADGTETNALRDRKLPDVFSTEVLAADEWISRVEEGILKVGGPIRTADGTRIGYLQVGFSLDRAYQNFRKTSRMSVYLTVICLAIGAILVFVLSTHYSRPIATMVRAAREIGEGRLDTRVDIERGDELGVLATSINEMAANLEAEILERKQAEAQLQASLVEKETLLKEIHHRVKNNLQVISSLLYLQSHALTDPQQQALFRESQDRVRSMALIHETLYQSNDLARIDIAHYLEHLVRHLCRSYSVEMHRITLTIQAEPVFLDIDRAIPCGLILNELLTNALKYAFPGDRTGALHLGLQAAPEQVMLVIRDTGVGLPEGVDVEHTPSLGLRLVHMLTIQLGGTLTLERGEGTAWTLTFPADRVYMEDHTYGASQHPNRGR